MELAALAGTIVSVLRPFLKGLVSRAEEIGEDAGRDAGKGLRDLAGKIWTKLSPSVQAEPAASKAAHDAASAPDDERVAGRLEVRLEEVLQANPSLAEELRLLIEEANASGALGDSGMSGEQYADRGGVNVGRDVHGDVRTGDQPD